MYRKYINDLLNWYKDSRRKPLMLWGARQVGKTWLMQEFGKVAFAKLVVVKFINIKRERLLISYSFR